MKPERRCYWCGSDAGVVSGLLITPVNGEEPNLDDDNKVPCCLACRSLRGRMHLGDWVAECLQAGRDYDPYDLRVRLRRMAANGVSRASSSIHNVKQAETLRKPSIDRMLRIEPLVKRGNGQCVWCRRPLSIRHSEVSYDHLVPRSLKGNNSTDNILLSCRQCNSRRGNKPPVTWMLQLIDEGLHPDARRVDEALEKVERSGNQRMQVYARRWRRELRAESRRLLAAEQM